MHTCGVDQRDKYDSKYQIVVIWKTCCGRLSYHTDIAALFQRKTLHGYGVDELKSSILVTLSMLSVNPLQLSDESAAVQEQEPRRHRGIPSKPKRLSDHRYKTYSSNANYIITKNEDVHRLCYQRCAMISPRRHYTSIAWPTLYAGIWDSDGELRPHMPRLRKWSR